MPHLDALRAIAICAVLLEHWGGPLVRAAFPIGAGDLGVNLFFTLSGFLITSILIKSFDTRKGRRWLIWRDFYARRMLRLVPVFYLTILSLVIVDVGNMRAAWLWHVSYLSNVYVTYGGEKTVFWSLAVEEHFYLLWPFVIAFTPRSQLLRAVVILIVLGLIWKIAALAIGIPKVVANLLLPGNLETLGAGCALAVWSHCTERGCCFEWYRGAIASRYNFAAWSCLAMALGSWLVFGKTSVIRYLTNDLLMAVFYAWLVLHGARGFRGIVGRLFDLAPVQYVGRISYGVYVLHTYPPDIIEKYVGSIPKVVAAPIVVALTFGICALSWHFIEQPILRLKRFFRSASDAPALIVSLGRNARAPVGG